MITNFKTIIKEKNRMCNSFEECEDCYLQGNIEKYSFQDCYEYMENETDEFLKDMENWMKDNPRETNKSIFVKKFKNSPWNIENDKGLARCGIDKCNKEIPCSWCTWWDEPVDAENEERMYLDTITVSNSKPYEVFDVKYDMNQTDNILNPNVNNVPFSLKIETEWDKATTETIASTETIENNNIENNK